MKYLKQLDSLRAIAVTLVIIHHWFPENSRLRLYTGLFNGVDIFFVLSGFLITRILLQNRNDAEQMELSKSTIIKNFFIRRVLRIFPIYYLFLFGMFLFAHATDTTIRENFIYYVTYTVNIYFYNIQGWDGMLSHLWTLSVEEQFYLIWPWLMLFPRKSWLLPIILSSIITGILMQLLFPQTMLLTYTCLDGFGAGAFIAWALVYNPRFLVLTKMLWPVLAICGFSLQLIQFLGYPIPIPSRTLTAFVVLWVILQVLKERNKPLLLYFILNNRILIFIGKISYGIYLYHFMIPYFSYGFLYKINHFLPTAITKYYFYLFRLENFFLVILLAYLSWRFIELPVLRLKKYFEYQKPEVPLTKKAVLQPTLSNAEINN